MAFADKIRNFRKITKLTQKDLAVKLGITQKTISAWEVGRSEPTMKDIVKLCKIFDCTIEELTDTRQRRTGEITLDDLYARLDGLSKAELIELEEAITKRIKLLSEMEAIKAEKIELEKRLSRYEKRLAELEGKNAQS